MFPSEQIILQVELIFSTECNSPSGLSHVLTSVRANSGLRGGAVMCLATPPKLPRFHEPGRSPEIRPFLSRAWRPPAAQTPLGAARNCSPRIPTGQPSRQAHSEGDPTQHDKRVGGRAPQLDCGDWAQFSSQILPSRGGCSRSCSAGRRPAVCPRSSALTAASGSPAR